MNDHYAFILYIRIKCLLNRNIRNDIFVSLQTVFIQKLSEITINTCPSHI